MGDWVIASFSLLGRHIIIGEIKHEIEVMEKEEEDIEDWSSDDRDDVEWLDVTTMDSIDGVENTTRRLVGVEGDNIT